MSDDQVLSLLALYPRIFFACHVRHVRDAATGKVLSAHQASILDHLDARDALSLGGLAGHMGVTLGTMSLHVERLVRKGYVARARDPRDGRRVRLRLTPAGVRVREAKSVLDPKRIEKLLACLTPEEREDGLRGLAVLARAADESVRRAAAVRTRRKR
jgi:MarR family transcriptional regulator, organic hydroperoxide resistance regulator